MPENDEFKAGNKRFWKVTHAAGKRIRLRSKDNREMPRKPQGSEAAPGRVGRGSPGFFAWYRADVWMPAAMPIVFVRDLAIIRARSPCGAPREGKGMSNRQD